MLITGFKDVFGWVMIVIISACLLTASFNWDVGLLLVVIVVSCVGLRVVVWFVVVVVELVVVNDAVVGGLLVVVSFDVLSERLVFPVPILED